MKRILIAAALALTVATPAMAAETPPAELECHGSIMEVLFCRAIRSISQKIEDSLRNKAALDAQSSVLDAERGVLEAQRKKAEEALQGEISALGAERRKNNAALEAAGPACVGGGRVAGGHGQWGATGFSAKKWC